MPDAHTKTITDLQDNWEVFAQADPMWAILMDPDKTGNRWDSREFLATGEREITTVVGHLEALGITPPADGAALDFGCGLGRLTQALGRRFASATGVDIAPSMVDGARGLNPPPSCRFVLNQAPNLRQFDAASLDMIYSSVVLQHMSPQLARGYLAEFARLLRPGGVLVFQLPDGVARGASVGERFASAVFHLRRRLGVRTRLRHAARRLGVQRGPLSFRDAVAEMHSVPEAEVRALLTSAGLDVCDVRFTNSVAEDFSDGLRYLDAAPDVGWVSKQYTAVKPDA